MTFEIGNEHESSLTLHESSCLPNAEGITALMKRKNCSRVRPNRLYARLPLIYTEVSFFMVTILNVDSGYFVTKITSKCLRVFCETESTELV